MLLAQIQTSIGLKAGVSLAQWQMSEPISGSHRNAKGFTSSVPIEIMFNEKLGLQTELSFIQKGTFIEAIDNTWSTKITINYLEIPVLAKLCLGKKIKLAINTGPFLGVALNGKVINTESHYPTRESGIDFERDKVNRVDAGISMGLGVKIPVLNSFVTLEFRYAYGLVDVSTEIPNSVKVNNKGLNITVGFLVPTKSKVGEMKVENK